MTTPIEPALSAEEWARSESANGGPEITAFPKESCVSIQDWGEMSGVTVRSEKLPALIALANDALPAGDNRKITREWVDYLRAMADDEDDARVMGEQVQVDTARIRAMADALASYLRPEGT